jgi:hypothetical protein
MNFGLGKPGVGTPWMGPPSLKNSKRFVLNQRRPSTIARA